MGMTDQTGNEIDEFVTETLRNNLLGLPLDLAAINITRGRDAGVPPLNEFRRQLFTRTRDSSLRPYSSWSDFGLNLKHPYSLVNFIAAYGTHPSITGGLAHRRTAAELLVNGGQRRPRRPDGVPRRHRRLGEPTQRPGAGRPVGRRAGGVDAAVRRHARVDVQLRLRAADAEAPGRRPALLPGAYSPV